MRAESESLVKIGSLFSGSGMLDVAVESVTGAQVAWFAEIDKYAAKVLDTHFDAPNLGDITQVPWADVEPVDILTGGFPCQDVSTAGVRRGLKHGTRSGLWVVMAEAINELQPGMVVIENVQGLRSADAHSDVEPCEVCLGEGTDGALRALGAVLGDLAELGFTAEWGSVRASDVGAPHRRERVFIVAHRASEEQREPAVRRVWGEPRGGTLADANGGDEGTHAGGVGATVDGRPGQPTAPEGRRNGEESRRHTADAGVEDVADSDNDGNRTPTDARGIRRLGAKREVKGSQRQRAWQTTMRGSAKDATDSDSFGRHERRAESQVRQRGSSTVEHIHFGEYEPAIRRWEQLTGQPAPTPVADGRLNPEFTEWMMGWPVGWTAGLSRTQRLKICGNGVVPQQAALALELLGG